MPAIQNLRAACFVFNNVAKKHWCASSHNAHSRAGTRIRAAFSDSAALRYADERRSRAHVLGDQRRRRRQRTPGERARRCARRRDARGAHSRARAVGCAGAAPPAPIASLPGNVPRRPRRRRRRRRLPSADPSAPAPVVSAGGRGDGLDDDGVGASNVRDGTAGGGAGTASSPRMRRSVKSARVASDSTRSASPCISRLTRDTSVTSRWSTV